MTSIRSVCVYCGSAFGNDPVFKEAARALGCAMAAAGVRLVYGGGNVGLMGTVAKAVLDGGGEVTGIIPEFLKSKERMLGAVQELIVTADMHERKRLMFERADAFVALPGGIGTLEELVEIMTWAQLDRHRKPILLLNIAGFWDPLMALFGHMAEKGFLHKAFLGDHEDLPVRIVARVEDVIPTIRMAIATIPRQALEGTSGAELM